METRKSRLKPGTQQSERLTGLLKTLGNAPLLFQSPVVALLFDNDKGEPVVNGTALVVSYYGAIFLVSAAHVFDPIFDKTELYLYSAPKQKRVLTGSLNQTSEPRTAKRKTDKLDIGVLLLQGDPLPPYPEMNCYPLTHDRLLTEGLPRDGKHYFAVGFPSTRTTVPWNSKSVFSQPYGNYGPSIPHERYERLGINPQMHIAVAFSKRHVFTQQGKMDTFPDPEGMSGCPFWLVHDETTCAGNFPVAGILTDYKRSKRVLLATDIRVAMRMMSDALVIKAPASP